jgi:two-component system cell cycle response regulator DivK
VRVVIVEDDRMNAIVMNKFLTRLGGHQVTTTESVEKVRELIRAGEVDVVVMDVSLSNTRYQGRSIDGVEFIRVIRAEEEGRTIPILVATAHAMKGDAERLIRESGADGYIAKPLVDPQQFVSQVESCVRVSVR